MPSESVEAPEVSDIYVLVSHRLDGMLCVLFVVKEKGYCLSC